jgi:methyltransferase (TIGR00027 family)
MTRTEHDTWDTASGVGATATGCAAVRAVATTGPDPLFQDPYAALLVRGAGIDAFTQIVAGTVAPTAVLGDIAPALIEGMAVRTRAHDDILLDRARLGLRQVVMLASGLDTRAYRLAWPAATTVFDVDQDTVIRFKTTTLAEHGATPTCDHRPVAADLRYDWAARLTDAGFDRDAETLWLVEGLLPYLPPPAQDGLLETITELSAPGSLLIVENVADTHTPDSELRTQLQQVSEQHGQHGSALDVGALMYDGDRHPTDDYLAQLGWRTTIETADDMYQACGRPLAPGQRPFPDVRTVIATKRDDQPATPPEGTPS